MVYAALTICPVINQNTRPKILNITEEKCYELYSVVKYLLMNLKCVGIAYFVFVVCLCIFVCGHMCAENTCGGQ